MIAILLHLREEKSDVLSISHRGSYGYGNFQIKKATLYKDIPETKFISQERGKHSLIMVDKLGW